MDGDWLVGLRDGFIVSFIVGFIVGFAVGWRVGRLEGRIDGMGDGRFVGSLACFEALKSAFGPLFASAPTTKAANTAFTKFIPDGVVKVQFQFFVMLRVKL